MPKIISIKNLNLSYCDKKVFDNFNLDIEQGSFVNLTGPIGSGKTLLINMLLGILPYDGEIKIFDKNLNDQNQTHMINGVFENSSSNFMYNTVQEELHMQLKRFDYNEDEINRLIKTVSKKFEFTHLLDNNPINLSSGEKQLVALGCAIINNPNVLILDNALNMIDEYSRNKIYKVIKAYQKAGMTIINVTSNSEEIFNGTHVVVIKDGKAILNKLVKDALKEEKIFNCANVELPFLLNLSTKLIYYKIVSKPQLNRTRLVGAIWK